MADNQIELREKAEIDECTEEHLEESSEHKLKEKASAYKTVRTIARCLTAIVIVITVGVLTLSIIGHLNKAFDEIKEAVVKIIDKVQGNYVIRYSSYDLIDTDADEVEKRFIDIGCTDVRISVIKLKLGIIKRNNSVKYVTIKGQHFKEGDKYNKKDPVRICKYQLANNYVRNRIAAVAAFIIIIAGLVIAYKYNKKIRISLIGISISFITLLMCTWFVTGLNTQIDLKDVTLDNVKGIIIVESKNDWFNTYDVDVFFDGKCVYEKLSNGETKSISIPDKKGTITFKKRADSKVHTDDSNPICYDPAEETNYKITLDKSKNRIKAEKELIEQE